MRISQRFTFVLPLIAIATLSVGHAEQQDWEKIKASAAKGDATAQYTLGKAYFTGDGMTRDYSLALDLFRKAAEQGNAKAENNIGVIYQKGCGVKPDAAEALKWYTQAAEHGDATGQDNLGVMVANGRGTAKDAKKAAQWYQKAAEQGYGEIGSRLFTTSTSLAARYRAPRATLRGALSIPDKHWRCNAFARRRPG